MFQSMRLEDKNLIGINGQVSLQWLHVILPLLALDLSNSSQNYVAGKVFLTVLVWADFVCKLSESYIILPHWNSTGAHFNIKMLSYQ